MRRISLLVVAALLAGGAAEAEMATARWGVKGPVQHPDTLSFQPSPQGDVMTIDLSALPAKAQVYRARLLFSGVNWKEKGFDIVPAERGDGGPKAAGPRLEVAAPHCQWLDATEAVRRWAKAGAREGVLLMRTRRAFDAPATFLEIAYEGKGTDKQPPQTSQVKALYRAGQVLITFQEIDPPDGGREGLTWKDLLEKFRGDYYGPVPDHPGRRMTYQVYCHDRPITAANVGQARLLAEVLPGSAVNTRLGLPTKAPTGLTNIHAGRRGEGMGEADKVTVVRLAVERGKPLGPGTGVCVHTVDKAGASHYAVLAAEDGVVNARDISPANSVGPVRQEIAPAEPVLYAEFPSQVERARFTQQWYSFWTVQPMSPVPFRYDVGMAFCPELLKASEPMTIVRGGWNKWPTPHRPSRPFTGFYMCHTADQPIGDVDMRMGLHDSNYTIKGFDQGKWQPFLTNRQTALVEWACRTWPVDRNRINVHVGAWGAPDIRHSHLYAMIDGFVEPEMTKGWSCWERAVAIWGTPQMYTGRPDAENPYAYTNLTDWVLANPAAELPYVWCRIAGGHPSEIGWPPYPRFMWAMMRSKQPFLWCAASGVDVPDALGDGHIVIRRDRSAPAFANCSLDDNVGEGDIKSAQALGGGAQVNGWIMWDSENIEDTADRYGITVWVGPRCPMPDGVVDMTPRRCQKFKPRQGMKFTWTNTLLPAAGSQEPAAGGQEKGRKPAPGPPATKAKEEPANPPEGAAPTPTEPAKVVQSGQAAADQYGLVTIEELAITKGRHRVVLQLAQ